VIFRVVAAVLLFPGVASAACIPFDQAKEHIGEAQCVTGKVLRVEIGSRGVHYLDFCEDYRECSFFVVVFSYDVKNVGEVASLRARRLKSAER
jgi:hypothetical protein